jgi:hypothetical protein
MRVIFHSIAYAKRGIVELFGGKPTDVVADLGIAL